MFYYRNENIEYIAEGNSLFRKIGNEKKHLLDILPEDNPRNSIPDVCYLVEYKNFVVMLIDWSIRRNVLCFDKNTDELIWQLDDPKDVFKTRKNCWVRAYEVPEDPGEVMVNSVDGYRAAFDIATGKKTWEYDRKSGDPRDF